MSIKNLGTVPDNHHMLGYDYGKTFQDKQIKFGINNI